MPPIAPSAPRDDDAPPPPLNPYLVGVLRGFRSTFAAVFLFSFFVNLLTLTVPLYLLQIYAKVLPSGHVDTLVFLTGMALAAIATLGALEAIRRSVLARAGARLEHELGATLLDSSISRAIARSRPSVNALRELARLRGFIAGSTLLPLLDLPWTPLFVLVLFVLHPILGAIGTAGALVLLALAIYNERATRGPQRAASRRSRELLDDARAWVGNADVVEAMGLQPGLRSRWDERGAEATLAQHRAGRLNTRLSSLSKLVRMCLQVAVIAAAAVLITRGELTAGATIASVLLLRRAISPLEQSIRSWKAVLSAREGVRTISEYLDHAASLAPPSSLPAPSGTLAAARLSYRRPGESRSTFSRIALELPPGTFTALTGPTGAGKSTLLRVLAGVVAPTGGKVTIGGHDLSLWRADQRGPSIGYLPQNVSLFPTSVRENIARLGDAPIEEVIEAAERAGAHELVQSLPAGYDTLVDAEGGNLSGGQRQRIGYARALFGSPAVVLLDEPDASLDAEGRSALRKSLRRLRRSGVAVLAITHHASLEKLADRVYRLEGGKLSLERSDDERIAARRAEAAEAQTVRAEAPAHAARLKALPRAVTERVPSAALDAATYPPLEAVAGVAAGRAPSLPAPRSAPGPSSGRPRRPAAAGGTPDPLPAGGAAAVDDRGAASSGARHEGGAEAERRTSLERVSGDGDPAPDPATDARRRRMARKRALYSGRRERPS